MERPSRSSPTGKQHYQAACPRRPPTSRWQTHQPRCEQPVELSHVAQGVRSKMREVLLTGPVVTRPCQAAQYDLPEASDTRKRLA